jgi:hypothetical protein
MSSTHHGKEVNTVYETKDYDRFKFNPNNREIKQGHVNNLIKSMKERGWLPGSYVIVNRLFEIIDGQHRTLAAIAAKVPLRYAMEKNADDDTMSELNKNQKNWQLSDHLNGFVKKEIESYIKLDEFVKTFPDFKITEAMMFLSNQYKRVDRKTFEGGKFVTKDVKKAHLWAEQTTSLKPYFERYNSSIFVRALITCMSKPKFKFEELLHKVKLRPTSLVPCGTVDQYIELIEDTYNYRRNNNEKINLRF